MSKIQLGDEVKDSVTGFQGIVMAKTEWVTGCDRFNVQPKVGKDGKIPEAASFDEPMLILVKAGAVKVPSKHGVETGGPRATLKK